MVAIRLDTYYFIFHFTIKFWTADSVHCLNIFHEINYY